MKLVPRLLNPWSTCLAQRLFLWSLLLFTGFAHLLAGQKGAVGGQISTAAYPLLTNRIADARTAFYIYQDADRGSNHGFPSGYFASNTDNLSTIHLNAACIDDPKAANGCSTDQNRLDRQRGTILTISFDPQKPGEFAGVNIEEPRDWGSKRTGRGYDVRGATAVMFEIRTPTPGGVSVQFGVGEHTTSFVHIPQSPTYRTMSITFASLGLSSQDLADLHVLFTVVTNDVNAPNGGTVLLDNIRFVPVPDSAKNATSFPLANQTFGVLPHGDAPFPSDQISVNLTTIYESAMTGLTLRARGTTDDLSKMRLLADAFDYALHHENHGDPLPVAQDGSMGIHNGYESHDLGLYNDQGPGMGQAGDVRLAGFSCGISPTGYCLVLDGATGGNNAFALLFLARAFQQFGDARYLEDAKTIGNWIYNNLLDKTGTGYGGYYLGYPDQGVPPPKPLLTGKSVENNADIFAAMTVLAAIDTSLAGEWTRRANIAGDFVMRMFDPVSGRFYAGTVPAGTPSSPGINPTGPQQGNDVINDFDFLDSNSFTTLALAGSPRYRNQIDWRRPVHYIINNFSKSITAGGKQFQGFSLVKQPDSGADGIAWEFTSQTIVAMRFVDQLYSETVLENLANSFLKQVRQAQLSAPFADGKGLVAATVQNGDKLTPLQQCLDTPFQCLAERVGLAATTWAILADLNVNVLASPANTSSIHTVTNLNDSGAGSLRQAIIDANPGDTIDFAANLTGTITLTTAELVVGKNLTISGPGLSVLTVSGNNASRVFNITGGIVSISGLTIANGHSTSANGGGIYNDGTLTVASSAITDNQAYYGGGIFNGSGRLTLINSSLTDNSAGGNGGGVANLGSVTGETLKVNNSIVSGNIAGYFGAGIYNNQTSSSTATVTESTFSGNGASIAGGGGIWNEYDTLTVSGCTLSGNTAATGGGIANKMGTVMVRNSTLSGNVATGSSYQDSNGGGGIANGSVYDEGGVLEVINSTLFGNSATGTKGGGGGIQNTGAGASVRNTIIAGNGTSTSGPDCSGTINSQDYNLIQNPAGCTISGATAHNILGQDPKLGALQNNGGPTSTHALQAGSPAIDAGDNSVLVSPLNLTTDQRGFTRKVGSAVDIGAYEFGAIH
jgi:hypothetical protein